MTATSPIDTARRGLSTTGALLLALAGNVLVVIVAAVGVIGVIVAAAVVFGSRLLGGAAVRGRGGLLDQGERDEDGCQHEDGEEPTTASGQGMAGCGGRCGGAHRGRHGENLDDTGAGDETARAGGGGVRGPRHPPQGPAGGQAGGATSPKCVVAG